MLTRHTNLYMPPLRWPLALLVALIWCAVPAKGAAVGAAGSGQVLESEAQTCITQTMRVERTHAIPRGLLGAIALAESGRWNKSGGANGEIIAWPWTVTARGKGNFFPTRAGAVTFVYELMADGIENIDVGCMQINLMHHADAFADIQSAFDPAGNVAYGAEYLIARYESAKSWIKAAGDYHSTTPKLNRKYRDKVRKLWRSASALRAPHRSRPPSAQAPHRKFNGATATIEDDGNVAEPAFKDIAAALSPRLVDRFDLGPVDSFAPAPASPAARHIKRLSGWRVEQVRTIGARHARNLQDVLNRQASLGLPTGRQPYGRDTF